MVPPLSQHERDLLEQLRSWARQAQDRPDAKLTAFRAWLDPIVKPGDWSDERVIIFTEYRDTQHWLYERLIGGGIPGRADRSALRRQGRGTSGSTSRRCSRSRRDLDPVRILLATDAASEGIDLQNHCHRLLHCEIPWNPNRLEQRNGRIDRHGQHAPEVDVFHFVPAGWARTRRRAPARQRARGRAVLPVRGGEEGRADPRGPGQRRRGHRRAGRAEDARQAGRLADRRRRDRRAGPAAPS